MMNRFCLVILSLFSFTVATAAELSSRYKAFGGPVEIEVVAGQGHNMWKGWFESQRLTDFAVARAPLGKTLSGSQSS